MSATQFVREFPTGALPPALHNNDVGPNGAPVLSWDEAFVDIVADQVAWGSTSRPIAQRKAAISRAIATVTTDWRFPRAMSLR